MLSTHIDFFKLGNSLSTLRRTPGRQRKPSVTGPITSTIRTTIDVESSWVTMIQRLRDVKAQLYVSLPQNTAIEN